ncbi:MAG: hypothetical protein WCX71_01525 [Candidatus Buchananbacteria bacterium]
MIPFQENSYHILDNNPLSRVRFYINERYVFTIGVYKNEMGFFVDFPKFSKCSSNLDNISFPAGVMKNHNITIKNQEGLKFCPKLSFHESGFVLFSKTRHFFNKIIVRNQPVNSIYEHWGEHIFTLMMQRIDLLEKEEIKIHKKTSFTNRKFGEIPPAVKFIGNLWNEDDLKECFPNFGSARYLNRPIVWANNVEDVVVIFKFSHLSDKEPLYLTIRTQAIDILDKNNKDSVILSIMAGWNAKEMDDVNANPKFIGLIAKK